MHHEIISFVGCQWCRDKLDFLQAKQSCEPKPKCTCLDSRSHHASTRDSHGASAPVESNVRSSIARHRCSAKHDQVSFLCVGFCLTFTSRSVKSRIAGSPSVCATTVFKTQTLQEGWKNLHHVSIKKRGEGCLLELRQHPCFALQ